MLLFALPATRVLPRCSEMAKPAYRNPWKPHGDNPSHKHADMVSILGLCSILEVIMKPFPRY